MPTNKAKLNQLFEFVDPTLCLQQITNAYAEYQRITEQEQTKRREIAAWEQVTIEEVRAKRDALIAYLDRSFDERTISFKKLFDRVDAAIACGDNVQLGLLLHAITEIAKSNPFQNLCDLNYVQKALNDPEHTWEI